MSTARRCADVLHHPTSILVQAVIQVPPSAEDDHQAGSSQGRAAVVIPGRRIGVPASSSFVPGSFQPMFATPLCCSTNTHSGTALSSKAEQIDAAPLGTTITSSRNHSKIKSLFLVTARNTEIPQQIASLHIYI